MKKMLFILNPNAGTKKAAKHLMDMIAIFNRADYDVSVYITEAKGDAERMAFQMAQSVDAVVCCGGDGTFNEAMSGVLRSGVDVPLGYIPAGSTNDFASSLNLPADMLEAARNVVEGQPVTYDVGKFGDRYFSYVASFGAFTRASYATPQNVKNALGHTAYILSGIQELSQIREIAVKLEMDGQVLEGNYLFGAICNSTSVAGILTLDPNQVDMRDGRFEVLLVRSPKDLAEVAECIQAFQNKTYNCKMVSFLNTEAVTVTMEDPVDWTLDGEYQPGAQQVRITNEHFAIRLLTRENQK